jgi:hypothetical protein
MPWQANNIYHGGTSAFVKTTARQEGHGEKCASKIYADWALSQNQPSFLLI